jgi:hypothetical protein
MAIAKVKTVTSVAPAFRKVRHAAPTVAPVV